MFHKFLLATIFLVIIHGDTGAQDRPVVPREHTAVVETRMKKDGDRRARIIYRMDEISGQGSKVYRLQEKGRGDFDEFEDVSWTVTARMRQGPLYLRTLNTLHEIYDGNQNVLMSYEKKFDYTRNRVSYIKKDGRSEIVDQEEYTIKGPICDEITLIHFLKTFAAHYPDKQYASFYLLTKEPKLYHVNIKFRGEEPLDLPSGEILAKKFQLMADLGPLTELAAKMVPPTYVWYTSEAPYNWLQYEGMESGYRSANVVSSVVERDSQDRF